MNKSSLEKDFYQRFGGGAVHICFVPLPLPIIGADCHKYGGSTVMCTLSCGVWLCARIRSDGKTVIEHTSDNTKSTLAKNSVHSVVYRFLERLLLRLEAQCGLNLLFHCDIPYTNHIDIISAYLIAAAAICDSIFSSGTHDIPSLVSDYDTDYRNVYIRSIMNSRKNHIMCINDGEYSAVPIDADGCKLVCAYPMRPSKTRNLQINPPLALNQLKPNAVSDKSSPLYKAVLSSHNALAAYKHLAGGGDLFATFGEKCSIDGCRGKFTGDTDIYLTSQNSIDYAIEQIDRGAQYGQSFIVSDIGGGITLW